MNSRSNYRSVNVEMKDFPEIEDKSTTTQSDAAQISSSSNITPIRRDKSSKMKKRLRMSIFPENENGEGGLRSERKRSKLTGFFSDGSMDNVALGEKKLYEPGSNIPSSACHTHFALLRHYQSNSQLLFLHPTVSTPFIPIMWMDTNRTILYTDF